MRPRVGSDPMDKTRWLLAVALLAAVYFLVVGLAVTLVGDSTDPSGGEFGPWTVPAAFALLLAAAVVVGYGVDRSMPRGPAKAAFGAVGAILALGTAPFVLMGAGLAGPGPRGEVLFQVLVLVPVAFLALATLLAGGVLAYRRYARFRPPEMRSPRRVSLRARREA